MNVFTVITFLGGLGAIVSFLFGARAVVRYGSLEEPCGLACWTWRGIFTFCVFMTILSAPLSR